MVDLKTNLDAITRDTSDIELHALCLRARARILALEAQLAERVKVKPLEWRHGRLDTRQHETIRWEAFSLLGAYTAYEVYGKCWYETPTHNDFSARPAATIEEAKAAAQADFDRRILSALEATPPAPKVTECATEGCEQPAGIHFIRDNVGSHYCIECYKRVQRISLAALSGDAS